MATPLDLRNRRREAQRTFRLTLNAVNSALDGWKRASKEGKASATELTNAVLTERRLPTLPLGALEGIPSLISTATTALHLQQERHFLALTECLQQLQASVTALSAAVASVSALSDMEKSSPLLGDAAVFTSLSIHTVARMLGEVLSMYTAELTVKQAVVEGFRAVPGEFLGRGQPGGGAQQAPVRPPRRLPAGAARVGSSQDAGGTPQQGCHGGQGSQHAAGSQQARGAAAGPAGSQEAGGIEVRGGGSAAGVGSAGGGSIGGGEDAAPRNVQSGSGEPQGAGFGTRGAARGSWEGAPGEDVEELLRCRMQVYITAWMLEPEIEDGVVEAHLGCILEDMRGF